MFFFVFLLFSLFIPFFISFLCILSSPLTLPLASFLSFFNFHFSSLHLRSFLSMNILSLLPSFSFPIYFNPFLSLGLDEDRLSLPGKPDSGCYSFFFINFAIIRKSRQALLRAITKRKVISARRLRLSYVIIFPRRTLARSIKFIFSLFFYCLFAKGRDCGELSSSLRERDRCVEEKYWVARNAVGESRGSFA